MGRPILQERIGRQAVRVRRRIVPRAKRRHWRFYQAALVAFGKEGESTDRGREWNIIRQ